MNTAKKILIVDDDSDLQILLRRRLENSGYACTSAFSVEEALQDLEKSDFNLVILDLGFQNGNGTLFLKCAKDWITDQHRMPPVIVLSGFADKDIIDYVLELGAAQFVAKPYNPTSLLSTVQQFAR